MLETLVVRDLAGHGGDAQQRLAAMLSADAELFVAGTRRVPLRKTRPARAP